MTDFKVARAAGKRITDSIKATQVKGTVPSHALQAYTGNYVGQLYGNMKIELVNGALQVSYKKVQEPLIHFHYDQFITNAEGTDLPTFRLNFLTNNKGEIDKISTGTGDQADIFIKK